MLERKNSQTSLWKYSMPGNTRVMYLGTMGQPPFPKLSKTDYREVLDKNEEEQSKDTHLSALPAAEVSSF